MHRSSSPAMHRCPRTSSGAGVFDLRNTVWISQPSVALRPVPVADEPFSYAAETQPRFPALRTDRGNPAGQRFSCGNPYLRHPESARAVAAAAVGGDDSADDRTGRVDIPVRRETRGDGSRVFAQMCGCHPQRERHCVLRRYPRPITQHLRGLVCGRSEKGAGAANLSARLAVPESIDDGGDEFFWCGLGSGQSGVSRPTGRQSHRDRSGNSFGVRMGHLRRPNRFSDNLFRIASVIRAQWRDSHRCAVATGTLTTERGVGRRPPVHAVPDLPQSPGRGEAVVSTWLPSSGEPGSQPILIDAGVSAELGDQSARHLGVVGPLPLSGGDIACQYFGDRPAHHGETLPQCVSHGQSSQRIEHQVGMHLAYDGSEQRAKPRPGDGGCGTIR